MRRSTGPRKTANLSESVHQHLNMYALAAGAAGVAVLALAQAAEAKIVYTPANLKIVPNGGLITFDLNHDGVADFGLSDFFEGPSAALVAKPTKLANEIWGYFRSVSLGGGLCVSALPKGFRIGPKGQFQKGPGSMLGVSGGYHTCPWDRAPEQAYLGLKFLIKGKVHFAWARVEVKSWYPPPIKAVLTGYAYETIPGKAIIAGATKGPDDDAQPIAATHPSPTPKPATLGALALGAPGLSIWRREDPVAAASATK
jgi:hypothetical protein